MSLLVDISTSALDPSYAAAAARRAHRGAPRPRGSGLFTAGVVLLAVLLVVVAGLQAHREAPAATRARDTLVAQVNRATGTVDLLQRRVNRLSARTSADRTRLLADTRAGSALARRLARQELVAGVLPATGPGLRVSLADAPGGGADNRVLDRDLQSVVNALWAAGAEAVAINGQRLTAQSAIRSAGDTVLVNLEPLSSPYEITAIGDSVGLDTGFGSSHTAAQMRNLAQLYGLRFHYARAASVDVPAVSSLTLDPRSSRSAGGGSG